jgi:hypothetical protein
MALRKIQGFLAINQKISPLLTVKLLGFATDSQVLPADLDSFDEDCQFHSSKNQEKY